MLIYDPTKVPSGAACMLDAERRSGSSKADDDDCWLRTFQMQGLTRVLFGQSHPNSCFLGDRRKWHGRRSTRIYQASVVLVESCGDGDEAIVGNFLPCWSEQRYR